MVLELVFLVLVLLVLVLLLLVLLVLELAVVVVHVELLAVRLRSGCTAVVLHPAQVVAESRNRQASQASLGWYITAVE